MTSPLRTRSGRLVTSKLIEETASRFERGWSHDELRRRRSGRPSLGAEVPSPRIQVRVPQSLHDAVTRRAHDEGLSVSALVRELLEQYARSHQPDR